MTWNWQQRHWPNFAWDDAPLLQAEQRFLVGGGVIMGSVQHLSGAERILLAVEAMTGEAVATSEIEGEIVSCQRSILDLSAVWACSGQ